MANHKSAKKRTRQTIKRRARNRNINSRTRSAVKAARKAFESGDVEKAGEGARAAEGALRRAGSKGVIPKKRVSRQVSRLARAAHQVASS